MAQANIKAVITAEDRASGTLKKFGGAVDSASNKMAVGAKRALQALTVAGVAAATFAVRSAANFEQTRIGLENMLGSADKARVLLAKISKFAAETPFEFPELAQATRQLVAFGFSADEAYNTMKQLGDVSAAVGAPINDLAYLMGTLRAQGRAFTIDIRQFAMRGIPIYEYLAKVLKTNTQNITEMIEAGKIGFPEVQKAFALMTSEGEAFHGTMAKQSKSLSGLWSTLKDVIGQTAREMVGITQTGDVKEGSLFDKLRTGTAWLIDNLPKLISQMRDIVDNIVPRLKQWAANIAAVAKQVAEYLQPKLKALMDEIKENMPEYERFTKEVLIPLAKVIGTTLVVAIGLAIDALRILADVQSFTMVQMRHFKTVIEAQFNFTMGIIRRVIGWLASLGKAWRDLPGSVKAALAGLAAIIIAPFSTAFNFINRGINTVVGNINKIRNAASSIKSSADSFINKAGINPLKWDPLGLRGRASGGSVNAGQPYMVGERGAEMFVPNQSGTIRKNSQSGGGTINVNVNIGMYAGSEMEKRKIATALAQAYKDASGSNMAWGN